MRPASAAPSVSDGASNHAVATPSSTRQSVPISAMFGTVEPTSDNPPPESGPGETQDRWTDASLGVARENLMVNPTPPPDELEGIAKFWDDAAASFDDEPDHGLRDAEVRAAWASRLRTWLPAAPSDVLDLGCGTGSIALLLAEAGHRVTGVDLAPRMIELARAKLAAANLPATFLVGDAAEPSDRAVDVVLARHLVWTLPDPQAAVARWVSIVRPGGSLVMVEGRWSSPDGASYTADAPTLPWDGGVAAADLADAVRPLVTALRVERLSDDTLLWGRPVTDERYALVATV